MGEHHQPDHWHEFRFPAGQALTPAVGMRSSDASAFCDWLSARDSAFAFRLPQPGEMEHHLLIKSQNLSGTAEGFWTTDGFETVGLFPSFSIHYLEDLIRRDLSKEGLNFARTRAHTRDLDHDLDLDRAQHLDRALDRARDLAFDLDRDLAIDRARALDLELDRALDLDRDRGRALDLERNRDRDRAFDLDLDRARDFQLYREIRHIWRIFSLYSARLPDFKYRVYLSRLLKSRKKEQVVSHRAAWLPLYCDLVLLEARIEGIIPAIEGIRIVKNAAPDLSIHRKTP
ncbi:MAG: hypothetical protein QOF89_2145 [Acidobacteriota bacterium]|nr:hypothetical protein [Acidobacteriota bacterium]